MITYLGYLTKFVIDEYGPIELEIMVEARSGKLNTQAGYVMSRKDLSEIVDGIVKNKYNSKSIMDIRGLGYLPHTLELLAHRLWEDFDNSLGFESAMSRLKLSCSNYFVVYDGRREHKTKKKKDSD